MSRKFLLALMVFSLALSGAAFAAVENIKVSGDINAETVSRNLSMGSTIWTPGAIPPVPVLGPTLDKEDFIFSQVRLRFDADLTENVAATVQIINERLWGETVNPIRDDINLDLAYIEMQEFMFEPVTLVIGRQNIRLGNALIIGDVTTNQFGDSSTPLAISDLSLRKAFDAAKVILDFAPWTVTGFYAMAAEGATNIDEDVVTAGINAAYEWDSYNGITELYLMSQENEEVPQLISTLRTGVGFEPAAGSNTYTIGGRVQYDPNDNWTVGLEAAYQFGDANMQMYLAGLNGSTAAFAGQLMGEYRFLNDYDAKINLNYTYLSGDDDIGDGDWEGWNPMHEDQSPGEVMNILFANTNMEYVKVSGSMICPQQEDITLGVSYTYAKMAETPINPLAASLGIPAIYSPLVGPVGGNAYAVNRNAKELGSEIDAWMVYDYTEDVQLTFVGGWFAPGAYFTSANEDMAYSVRGGVSVDF